MTNQTAQTNRDRRNAGEDISPGSYTGTQVENAHVTGTDDALADTDSRLAQLQEVVDAMTKKLMDVQASISKKPAHGIPGVSGPVDEATQRSAYRAKFITHGETPFSRKVPVYIHCAEGDHNLPVHVSVNGFAWSLPRGETVEVPTEVVEVLEHAEVDGWQPIVTPEGEKKLQRVRYLRFPFSVINN